MRKIFKVVETENYLVINEEKNVCLWVSKDQMKHSAMSDIEKQRFLDKHNIVECEVTLNKTILSKAIKLESLSIPYHEIKCPIGIAS